MSNNRGNNHGRNKDFKSTSKCLVTERLIIHVCGESLRQPGAVIGITALKGNRIISYCRKKGTACIKHGHIKVFIWCAALILWTDFARGKSKAKEAHCACKGSAREIHWFLFGQTRFQWMALFVGNGRPGQATRTKADFCNSCEKQKQGLLIWSKMR